MPWKLVYTAGAIRREYSLPEGEVVLGRDPACAIPLSEEPKASKQHARLRVRGDRVVVEDLRSRNGTRVNGEPIEETGLREGDILQVGSTSLRLVREAAAAAPRPPDACIVVVAGGSERSLPLASSAATIGASPDNDLVLDGRGVSQVHAEVLPSDEGWVLHDLGSTNGSWVQGGRVEEQLLRPGDEIVLGEVVLRFESGKPVLAGVRLNIAAAVAAGVVLLLGLAWFFARAGRDPGPELPATPEASMDAVWALASSAESTSLDRAEALLLGMGKGHVEPEAAKAVQDFLGLERKRLGIESSVFAVDWKRLRDDYEALGRNAEGLEPGLARETIRQRIEECLREIAWKGAYDRAKVEAKAGRIADALDTLRGIPEGSAFGPSARELAASLRDGALDQALDEAARLAADERWHEAIDRLETAGALGADVKARLESMRMEAAAREVLDRLRKAETDGRSEVVLATAGLVPASSRYHAEARAIADRVALGARLKAARLAFVQGHGREAIAELEGLAGDEAAALVARVRRVVDAAEYAEREELSVEPEQALALWSGLLERVPEEGNAFHVRAIQGVADSRERLKHKASELAESFAFFLEQEDPATAGEKLLALLAMPSEFSAKSTDACRGLLLRKADELYRQHRTRMWKGELARDPELRRQARAAFELLAEHLPEDHPRRENARAALEQVKD